MMKLSISNEQLAMYYQLAISDGAAYNWQSLMANAWQMANRQPLMVIGGND
jgi:hypothetical protein